MAEPDRTNADAERVSDIVARLREQAANAFDGYRAVHRNDLTAAADIIEAQSKALAEAREENRRMKDRKITVFDWAYTDPRTGLPAYARTPEKARKLKEIGVKLTVVYTVATPTPENPNG